MVRLLTFSTLYPSSVRPGHGIFVESRLRHLVASGSAQSVVVAPVPWFPSSRSWFGKYSTFARTPRREVQHPRYPLLPKIGMSTAPFLLARACLSTLRHLIDKGYNFDVIDAHYFYPDGVAAALLGRHLGKPVVITARGSDIMLIARHAVPRRLIIWAARKAAAVIAVSGALGRSLEGLGIEAGKVTALRNGVDLEAFRPLDRKAEQA